MRYYSTTKKHTDLTQTLLTICPMKVYPNERFPRSIKMLGVDTTNKEGSINSAIAQANKLRRDLKNLNKFRILTKLFVLSAANPRELFMFFGRPITIAPTLYSSIISVKSSIISLGLFSLNLRVVIALAIVPVMSLTATPNVLVPKSKPMYLINLSIPLIVFQEF